MGRQYGETWQENGRTYVKARSGDEAARYLGNGGSITHKGNGVYYLTEPVRNAMRDGQPLARGEREQSSKYGKITYDGQDFWSE